MMCLDALEQQDPRFYLSHEEVGTMFALIRWQEELM